MSFDVFANLIVIPLKLAILTVILSLLYFILTDGFMNNVTLFRITKASFKLDKLTVVHLWMAYFIASLLMIYIYYYAQNFINPSGLSKGFLPEDIAFISLSVVFLGRIITKFSGVIYGRTFLTTFITFGALVVVIQLMVIKGHDLTWDFIIHSPANFIEKTSLETIWCAIGTLVLATLGEFVLSIIPPTNRSLMCISEKFPSDFRICTGLQKSGVDMITSEILGNHHGTIDELKEVLTSKHLKMVKCFTRSLWVIEKIETINKDYFIGLNKHNMRIIKLPDDVAEEKFAKDAFSRYPSLDYFLGRRKSQFDDTKEEYKKRLVLLEKYDTRNYDIGDLRFILVEYCDGDKVIIFLTRDTGPLGTIIGIYSEESYIIEIFNNIFNTVWEIATPAPHLSNSIKYIDVDSHDSEIPTIQRHIKRWR